MLLATHASALEPPAACSSAKRKASSKSAGAGLLCVSKAAVAGTPVDAACTQKAEESLAAAFSKADAKGGCLSEGDGSAFAAQLVQCVADVRAQLGVPGQPSASACTAAKLKAAAKRFSSKGKCHSAAAAKFLPVDAACLRKADDRFTASFAKAEEGADCLTTGDAAATGVIVDACLEEQDARLCADASGRACGALSTALSPQQSPEYYVDQANIYFDTLDTRFDPDIVPNYSPLTARWELPPWLYLTGYGRNHMISTTRYALAADPSTVPVRDCRYFPVQPFARCVVSFEYGQGSCPIYEEFTFNDQGQMTFVEAWSDLPGYLPGDAIGDRWAEAPTFHRLSTKVPGLGNASGLIDLDASWMNRAAAEDAEVADFVRRANDWYTTWNEALAEQGPDYFARGCGWMP